VAQTELQPSELGPPAEHAAEPESGGHIEERIIEPTGFPGLLGDVLGVRIDVPIYAANPGIRGSDPRAPMGVGSGVAVGARLSIEYYIDPTWQVIAGIDLSTPAFGIGVGVNLPSYLSLSSEIAIALQPHLASFAYISPAGAVILSGELSLRLGYSPIPHLVIAAELGVLLAGVIPFDSNVLGVIGGVYFGPVLGGGVEWAFY
jgi:hypothetical protein